MAPNDTIMKYLVQRPREDELLTSVLIRTSRRTGLPVGTLMQHLCNGRKWYPSFFQVGHIGELSNVFGIPQIDLLRHHTIFPYATAFFENEVFTQALAHAMSVGLDAKRIGPTIQGVSDYVPFRRFCTACSVQDLRTWGESHWRRSHNLPGVLVCNVHGQVLRGTNSRTVGPGTWSYSLPHETQSQLLLRFNPGPFAAKIAEISTSLLSRPLNEQHLRPAMWYRERLEQSGALEKSKQISSDKLISKVRAIMGISPAQLGFMRKDATLEWLPLMVRPKTGIPFCPLKHVLFQAALKSPSLSDGGDIEHIALGTPYRKSSAEDGSFAKTVRAITQDNVRRKQHIKVSDALSQAGCWSLYRHDRTRFPLIGEAVKELRHSIAGTPIARPSSLTKKP